MASEVCRHDVSADGRCIQCGMTYAEQSRQRKCDSLLPEGNGSTKLHTCYLPYNHPGKHENYLGSRVW